MRQFTDNLLRAASGDPSLQQAGEKTAGAEADKHLPPGRYAALVDGCNGFYRDSANARLPTSHSSAWCQRLGDQYQRSMDHDDQYYITRTTSKVASWADCPASFDRPGMVTASFSRRRLPLSSGGHSAGEIIADLYALGAGPSRFSDAETTSSSAGDGGEPGSGSQCGGVATLRPDTDTDEQTIGPSVLLLRQTDAVEENPSGKNSQPGGVCKRIGLTADREVDRQRTTLRTDDKVGHVGEIDVGLASVGREGP